MKKINWEFSGAIAIISLLVGIAILSLVAATKERDGEQNNRPKQEAISTQINQKVELIDMKTGYYNDYYPAIIMRWKNVSPNNITKSVTVNVAFFLENEELSQHNEYLHSFHHTPFERGTTRQIFVKSNIRLRNKGSVIAKIYVDDLLYDVVKVENQYLISNMLQ